MGISIVLVFLFLLSRFILNIIVIINFQCTKMKFSIKYIFSKCDQIRKKLRIWLHLLKMYLMENFIFCAAFVTFVGSHMSWNVTKN